MKFNRALASAIAVPALLAGLTGCAGAAGHGTISLSGTAGPAGVATPAPAATSGSTATGGSTTAPTAGPTVTSTARSAGCPAGGIAIPKSAGRATTADLDGDGRADTIWLADLNGVRTLGVRTASGAGFSTSFTSAAPQAAQAVAGRVQGGAVVLLDTGRSAQLYAVTGCKLVASLNPQGKQYSFDKGFTGYGTGAGCPVIDSSRRLAGYLAEHSSTGDTYTVTRTTVLLSSAGTRASNGSTVTLGTGLPASSPTVRTAQQVACGSSGRAQEPQS